MRVDTNALPPESSAGLAPRLSVTSAGMDVLGAAVVFGLIAFVPPFMLVAFATSSYAAGLVVASGVAFLILARQLPRLRIDARVAGGALFIAAWGSFPLAANGGAPMGKIVFSAALLSWLALVTLLIHAALVQLSDRSLIRVLVWFGALLAITAFNTCLLHYTPFGYGAAYGRPVIPFREPSHFALIGGPVFGALAVIGGKRTRLMIITICFALAMLFPSTSMAMYALVITAITSRVRHFVVVLSLTAVLAMFMLDFEYFTQRADFGDNSRSLTSLMWLQGLDDGVEGFRTSRGLGTGFQTMGYGPPGRITLQIRQFFGRDLNREGGGFMAAKLVGELGIVGVIMVLLLCRAMMRSALAARRAVLHPATRRPPPRVLAAHMFVALFGVELFVRGSGYFSPSLLLVAVALLVLRHDRLAQVSSRRSSLGTSSGDPAVAIASPATA